MPGAPCHTGSQRRGRTRLSEAAVVRLFHFQPVRSAFDTVLRDVLLPDLRAMPGATRAWAGRQGPSEVGTRLIVSVWTSWTAMRAALGDDAEDARSHPAQLEAITDRRLEVHPLVWMGSAEAPLTTGILRVTRGTLSSGDVATYEELLLHDVAAWRKEGKGPRAVILASRGPRGVPDDLDLAGLGRHRRGQRRLCGGPPASQARSASRVPRGPLRARGRPTLSDGPSRICKAGRPSRSHEARSSGPRCS